VTEKITRAPTRNRLPTTRRIIARTWGPLALKRSRRLIWRPCRWIVRVGQPWVPAQLIVRCARRGKRRTVASLIQLTAPLNRQRTLIDTRTPGSVKVTAPEVGACAWIGVGGGGGGVGVVVVVVVGQPV
jgi:hypothetical protein